MAGVGLGGNRRPGADGSNIADVHGGVLAYDIAAGAVAVGVCSADCRCLGASIVAVRVLAVSLVREGMSVWVFVKKENLLDATDWC